MTSVFAALCVVLAGVTELVLLVDAALVLVLLVLESKEHVIQRHYIDHF